jgi:formylglycine-generating enzyme required for sulfatase activity
MNAAVKQAIRKQAKTIRLGSREAPIELLRVEPGAFDLGSPPDEAGRLDSEGPVRRVTLTRPFYLGRYPVTQRQYAAVTGVTPAKPAGPDVAADQLSYADAIAFCEELSRIEGIGVGLPTEAQWEYACRAGTVTRFWSGGDEADLARVGWCRDNSGLHAQPVGLKPPNPWGFHDMHGNVCEFCRDALPSYRLIRERDPVGRTSRTQGIMRGGAWTYPASYCRSATRLMSNDRFGGAGLRIAAT